MNDDEVRWLEQVQAAQERGPGYLHQRVEDAIARNIHTSEKHQLQVHPMSEILQRLRTLMRLEFPRSELFYQLVIAHDFDQALTQRGQQRIVEGTPADAGDGQPGLVVPFSRDKGKGMGT